MQAQLSKESPAQFGLALIALSFFIIVSISLLSCNYETTGNIIGQADTTDYTVSTDSIEGIRLKVSAVDPPAENKIIFVRCTLFNDNDDTTYYVTSTCVGEMYSLQYDTALFRLNPMINCNVSFPEIGKIAPHDSIFFETHFVNRKTATSSIKLGFDLFKVNAGFNIEHLSLAEVHYRPEKNKTVVWADLVKIDSATH